MRRCVVSALTARGGPWRCKKKTAPGLGGSRGGVPARKFAHALRLVTGDRRAGAKARLASWRGAGSARSDGSRPDEHPRRSVEVRWSSFGGDILTPRRMRYPPNSSRKPMEIDPSSRSSRFLSILYPINQSLEMAIGASRAPIRNVALSPGCSWREAPGSGLGRGGAGRARCCGGSAIAPRVRACARGRARRRRRERGRSTTGKRLRQGRCCEQPGPCSPTGASASPSCARARAREGRPDSGGGLAPLSLV